jgi:hypothetical protein
MKRTDKSRKAKTKKREGSYIRNIIVVKKGKDRKREKYTK